MRMLYFCCSVCLCTKMTAVQWKISLLFWKAKRGNVSFVAAKEALQRVSEHEYDLIVNLLLKTPTANIQCLNAGYMFSCCSGFRVSRSLWCWKGARWLWWRISSSAGGSHLLRRRKEFTVFAPELLFSKAVLSLVWPNAVTELNVSLLIRKQYCRLKNW